MSDEQAEIRELVRAIRAKTITYETEDEAVAAVNTLLEKTKFQAMREVIHGLSVFVIEYPTDDEDWPRHMAGELAEKFAMLLSSYGEMEL